VPYKDKESARAYYRRNKEVWRRSDRKKRYGLTPERYQELWDSQDGLCALCRENSPTHVDHDHKTGEVRALLCITCNSGLGFFGERIELLHRAIDYLRQHRIGGRGA